MPTPSTDFDRIAAAISYMVAHAREQPRLETVAKMVHLSASHFQRMFTKWAGTSPKKFVQYVSIARAKHMMRTQDISNGKTALRTGLSGSGRLHDLFVRIEGMTPGEYKHGGKNLTISYSFSETLFGQIIIASTEKGICYVAFIHEGKDAAFCEFKAHFPLAHYVQKETTLHRQVLAVFKKRNTRFQPIPLHVKGTPFQLKVWEALLRIPAGSLTAYNTIACEVQKPDANRAVGTAVGANPVAFLIPCHRVIQSTGVLGKYRWGSDRKAAMIGWEAAACGNHNSFV